MFVSSLSGLKSPPPAALTGRGGAAATALSNTGPAAPPNPTWCSEGEEGVTLT